ncbi:hypothetical protein [uncultured Formosa sp.]|uniref:hypothetical protein n=1 Tax=uncultured Formosa sp. TaxID=255435 RepID=UPI002623EEBC|nr:hypothetical protein [uncultured Formosa sp.]
MNKPTIFLLLILTLFSCQKNIERIDIANELRGNTFDMTSKSDKDTLTIELKDSTYSVFEYSDRNLPWRTTNFDNTQILVLELRTMAIKQLDENTFNGLLIGVEDYEITLKKRNPKWNKDLLIGKWVEKESADYYSNNSIPKPPPLPPPPDFTEADFQAQPIYKISEDSISLKTNYFTFNSEIDINSSNEYLTMKLYTNLINIDIMWQIKELTENYMIIDKSVIEKEGSMISTTKTIENIELIKKR